MSLALKENDVLHHDWFVFTLEEASLSCPVFCFHTYLRAFICYLLRGEREKPLSTKLFFLPQTVIFFKYHLENGLNVSYLFLIKYFSRIQSVCHFDIYK